ncbi:MAG: DUF971 domain-containing protein [Magnetococcales bacterium]|nr:DUF971 domain-containing protein [Magnetococcales bacterium]
MNYGSTQTPVEIRQKRAAKVVEIAWANGRKFTYPMEYLRIGCPCADCRGHTPDQAKLIDGKEGVGIDRIEPVGHYAVKITFSDGHDTGVFSWEVLWDLGENQDAYWKAYLQDLERTGKRRKPTVFPIKPV